MRDGGYLVNTARSWVVDQDALLVELQSGRIRAALDVFDHEPLPSDHPYRSLPNVILTPHIAGGTLQTRNRQGECAVTDLENVFAGHPLQFEVTLERYPILSVIGGTPLVRIDLERLAKPGVEVYAKLEYFNPGGSIKDRPVLFMLLAFDIRLGYFSFSKSVAGVSFNESADGLFTWFALIVTALFVVWGAVGSSRRASAAAS